MGDGGSSNVEGGRCTALESNPWPSPPARRGMLTFGVSDQMTACRVHQPHAPLPTTHHMYYADS